MTLNLNTTDFVTVVIVAGAVKLGQYALTERLRRTTRSPRRAPSTAGGVVSVGTPTIPSAAQVPMTAVEAWRLETRVQPRLGNGQFGSLRALHDMNGAA